MSLARSHAPRQNASLGAPALRVGSASSQRRLFLERLEDRLALSGFGPEDGAYIVESWAGYYRDVEVQPADQKIIAAGTSGSSQVAVARYDALGSPDVGYGTGGLSTPPGGGIAGGIVLQPDGKAVVSSTIAGLLGAGRFNVDGSLDSTFGSDGWTSVNAHPGYFQHPTGIGRQSTGEIVVGGYSSAGAWSRSAIMGGFKPNGAVNSGTDGFGQIVGGQAIGSTVNTFGGTLAEFTSIAVQPDNKIIAVGDFSPNGSAIGQLLVARYTASGVLDTTFNASGYSILSLPGISNTSAFYHLSNRVALQPDGKIVVASSSRASDGEVDMLVTRFNANGTLDTDFGGGSGFVRLDIDGTDSETGRCVMIQPDGKIVAVGGINGSPSKVLVARLNSDGTLDSTFGESGFKIGAPAAASGLSFFANGMALLPDGSIIVAGSRGLSGDENPFLMRFFGDPLLPAAIVTPTSGLSTTEAGGQAAFTVSLYTQPTENVTIPISSSDTNEGTVSTASLTFTPADWNVPQIVTITGVDDTIVDGDIGYTIVLGPATSADSLYSGLDPADVSVTNTDDDLPPTKFYVVDDASANLTFEYGANGESVENYTLNSGNAAPRGAASTAAGDKVWVVDNNKKVYVYSPSGSLLGSWTAGGLSQPEGIATNGTDVWIVDASTDRVYKYAGAASLLSGSQNAASNFKLKSGNPSNTNPKDIVTDGVHLWVVNDSSTDMVFKYTTGGTSVGSWTITTAGASSPTGITLDPTSVSHLWIVDSGTDRVYQYNASAGLTSGSKSANSSFALAAGNANPQGIADPPPLGGEPLVAGDAPTSSTSAPATNDVALVQRLDASPPRSTSDAVSASHEKSNRLPKQPSRADVVAGISPSNTTLVTRPTPARIVAEPADTALEDVLAEWDSDQSLALQLP